MLCATALNGLRKWTWSATQNPSVNGGERGRVKALAKFAKPHLLPTTTSACWRKFSELSESCVSTRILVPALC